MALGVHGAASGSRNEAVVHSGDLMISEPKWHLNWMPRLATSRKLSLLKPGGVGQPHSSFFFTGRSIALATKEQKKENLKQQIITAANAYSRDLAGKTFLYVYGNEYFEVLFPVDRFLHLTGVETGLRAKDFYQKAKDGILDIKQFYFTPVHSLGDAKKKLPCLNRLSELTNTMVCIVKNMATVTLTYTIGVTNLEFTLGLTENVDKAGNRINDLFLPRTLRVKDKSIDISTDGDIVDFIFMKDASVSAYDHLQFADPNKQIPKSVETLILPSFYPDKNQDESE